VRPRIGWVFHSVNMCTVAAVQLSFMCGSNTAYFSGDGMIMILYSIFTPVLQSLVCSAANISDTFETA